MSKYGDLFSFDRAGIDLLSAPDTIKLTGYKITKIPQHMVGKPWVMAQIEYGDFRLWWAIIKVNHMRIPMILRDTFRVREGKPNVDNIITDFYLNREIVLPTIDDINEYIGRMKRD